MVSSFFIAPRQIALAGALKFIVLLLPVYI